MVRLAMLLADARAAGLAWAALFVCRSVSQEGPLSIDTLLGWPLRPTAYDRYGSWTSIGALLVGTDTLNSVTLRGAKETKALDAKCQNPSSPSATPSQSSSPAQHKTRRYRLGAPSEGT